METESLLARNTRVNRAIQNRGGFLLLDSMTCDLLCSVSQSSSHELKHFVGLAFAAKIGVEVAKESTRNEKTIKKSLEAKSSAYAYAPKTDVRTHCHDLGGTSKLELDPMHSHLKVLCVRNSGQICAYK
ncbi:hypothetical protein PIB30_047410 [Stylosanthes scabra]|uniref:Uncharacterized protein n=1 Tax=Stylosanthes scabra TaxID=79078 RepID=A0ABU6RH45_9FABA|nr:hypothetical protein [Stylosanthes scabra]